jgi:transcriptional regulator with GAF, ATPase, and Fis domain
MIRNIKQATNLANQNRVLRAANRIAHILSKTEKIEESIEELMTEFLEVVQADEGSIQLLRPSSQRTQRTLIRKAGEKNSLLKNRIDDLMTGWTVRHAKTLLTDNVTAVFNLGPSGEKYADIGSILAARLVAKEEAIGVVNLVRSGRRDPFTGDDKEVLTLLCEEISEFIEVAQLREKLFSENERLKQELAGRFDRHGIIGKSAALKEVFTLLNHVAPTDGRVMIHGESGTGKELIAKYIHNAGPRKDRPFIAVDCGALPGNLLESELFGYVRVGRSPAPIRTATGYFRRRMAAPFSLTKLPTPVWRLRRNYCVFYRRMKSGLLAQTGHERWTSASSWHRHKTSGTGWKLANSARTFSIA